MLKVVDDPLGELKRRLSARPDDVLAGVGGDGLVDFVQRHLDARVKLRVAEATAEVALT